MRRTRSVRSQDRVGFDYAAYRHIFVVSAEGGTSRLLTDGPWDHDDPDGTPDGREILFTSLRIEEAAPPQAAPLQIGNTSSRIRLALSPIIGAFTMNDALLQILRPPYRRYETADPASLKRVAGPVVVIDGATMGRDPERWRATVTDLQRNWPFAPVVARFPDDDAQVALTRFLGVIGVRAVLRENDPPERVLRHRLTRLSGLNDHIGQWLKLQYPALDPRAVELIRAIFRAASRHTTLRTLLIELGQPERTARRWLSRGSLPRLGDWLRCACSVNDPPSCAD